jgi:hypothetical protein
MNIRTETDSIDGKAPERQLTILLTDIALLVGSWFLLVGFEWLTLTLARCEENEISLYLQNMEPITLFFWGAAWIMLAPRGFVNPKGNRIQATHNPFKTECLPEGGTRFIVYLTGFGFKYLWERLQGPELAVENEVMLKGTPTTVSIKKISLDMEIVFLYRVHLPRLSSYLQNGTEEGGLDGILDQIKSAGNQYVEEASTAKDNTEIVRGDQTDILNTMLARLKPEALQHGINILNANFAKCDYPTVTQTELNKTLEATVISEIADKMGIADRGRAMELAAVIAGKPGAKVTRQINELIMSSEIAEAIRATGPVAAALLAGKANNQQNQP